MSPADLVVAPNDGKAEENAAWRAEMYATWMFTRRETARFLNVWGQTVVPPVVSAALSLLVFGHALGDRVGDINGVSYLTFILPGLVVQGALVNSFANTGSSLFDARRAGYIDDVLTSPLRDWQIVVAYTLSGTARGVLIGLLTALLAVPAVDHWDVNVGILIAALLLSNAIFALLGILTGLWASRWDHVFVPQTFVMTPLIFLGGVFYPVSLLSPGLQAASKFNPLVYLVDLHRGAVSGTFAYDVRLTLAALLVTTGLLYVVTLRIFATSERLRG